MGTTFDADVPGNVHWHTVAYGSLASNGTDRVLPFHPGGAKIQVLSAWIEPHSSQAGSATNFPDVKLINIGSGSAGTAVIANKAFSATGASVDVNTKGAFVVNEDNVIVQASERVAVSHEQAANGLDLVAHTVHMAYRLK